MQTSVEVLQAIEDHQAIGAKIYENAKRENRSLTEAESLQFQNSCDEAQRLESQLTEATNRENEIRNQAMQRYQNSAPAQNAVLPINGREPGEQQQAPQVHLRQRRLKAFKNERDAYNAGMWLKAFVSEEFHGTTDHQAKQHCERLGWQIRNSGNEGQGSAGGYLVPAPLSQTIIDHRESHGVCRRTIKIMPMGGDTLDVPKRVSGLEVRYAGEGNAMTPSDKTWGNIRLVADKRYVCHQISQELVDDSIISIVDDAVGEMAFALSRKEDQEYILGDGTSAYGGVVGLLAKLGAGGIYTAATNMDTWNELELHDFTSTMGKLPSRYHVSNETSWIASSEFFYSVMVRCAFELGGSNAQSAISGIDGMPMFLGRPVYFTDYMPQATAAATVHCLFGNFAAAAILGERVGVRVARSDDYAFLNDLTTIKATARYDVAIHSAGTDTEAGAFIGLKTAS
jgi:HK97 family phage major capsid protein